jgi:acetyl esterase/lipase
MLMGPKPTSRTWLALGSAIALLGFLMPCLPNASLAADLPKTIESGPCRKAPTIDGVLGENEWKDATTLKFEMAMTQFKPLAVKAKRTCELRVMNSANYLYVLLRVPTEVSHASLNPVDLDLAILAFCQGSVVTKGDDRKVLSPGLGYRDKSVVGVGKDEDDPQQDGNGAVQFDQGWYTFEWAVPLDTKDLKDLCAKPGDSVRFNIAYFDRFAPDLKNTQGGGLYGPDLEKPVNWGLLKLAADVKPDGGPSLVGLASGTHIDRDVVYSTRNGIDLKLNFVRPSGKGPFPLVVCIHGGGWQFGTYNEYMDFQKAFAAAGIASASVQYRFAPKDRFPAQLDDIIASVRFLAENQERFRIDPNRIGMMGGSAGGHLALLGAFSDIKGCSVKAVANVAGPTDLRVFVSSKLGDAAMKNALNRTSGDLLEDLLGTKDRNAQIYANASPVTRIRQHGPAVLTIHGTDDEIVPYTQAELLHAALKKVNATERLLPIKGGGHDFAKWPEKERLAVASEMIEYFKTHLKSPDPRSKR